MSYTPLTYQQTMIDKMQAGGFKPGELSIIAAGRQTGKSMLSQWYGTMPKPKPKFTMRDQAQVDGATWYTITCNLEVSAWLRDQPKELQHSHIDIDHIRYFSSGRFDIHEKLYTLLALKWS